MANGPEVKKGMEKPKEVATDRPLDQKEAAEKKEALVQKAIFEIEDKIKANGFDSRHISHIVDGKRYSSDGKTIHFELTEGGTARYGIALDLKTMTCSLMKVDADNSRTPIEVKSNINQITFPVSALALRDLLINIKNGAMDSGLGTTKFTMKAEKIGDAMRYRFSKVGMMYDTEVFALEYDKKNDTYSLLKYLGKPDRTPNEDSDEFARIGKPSRNPYDLINRYSQTLLPDTLSSRALNAGNSCRSAPHIYPPRGMFDRDRNGKKQ